MLQSVIDDMKLNYEILLSRVDALQSLANSQIACPQNDKTVNLEIELIEERSKNMKLESTISLMAMKNDSEIEALKCKIKSLEIKLDKCINDVNPLINAETPNTFQSSAYGAIPLKSCIVQPKSSIVRPESSIVPPHLTEVPLQSPSLLSPQVNKRNEDVKQTSSFLNKLPLSEPEEINCIKVDYLNDIPLLPQSSFALAQSPIVRSSDANKRSQDINYFSKKNSRKNKESLLVAPKIANQPGNLSVRNNKPGKPFKKSQNYNYNRRGLYQSKSANSTSGRDTFPFRINPAKYRPPRIALVKQLSEWGNYLEFVRSTLAE